MKRKVLAMAVVLCLGLAVLASGVSLAGHQGPTLVHQAQDQGPTTAM